MSEVWSPTVAVTLESVGVHISYRTQVKNHPQVVSEEGGVVPDVFFHYLVLYGIIHLVRAFDPTRANEYENRRFVGVDFDPKWVTVTDLAPLVNKITQFLGQPSARNFKSVPLKPGFPGN